MGAFDDITSQYGKAAGNGNAFEDITTEYGDDVATRPSLHYGIVLKIMPNMLLMALKTILNGLIKQAKKLMIM